MGITNFHGLAPILMNEAGGEFGGGGGGGESTALATTAGTVLDGAGDGTGGDGADGGNDGALAATGADIEPVYDHTGKVTLGTSKIFRGLEGANPAARAVLDKAQRALGTVGKLTAMLGAKPVERVAALMKFEKEVGGAKGLETLRAGIADMEKSDELYEKADPMLLKMMTETPLAKQAFVKLFPHSVNKLREIAPNTYTQWLGKQILHWIEKAEIGVQMKDGKVVKEDVDLPRRLRRMVGCLPWTAENGQYTGGTITPEQAQTLAWDIEYINAFLLKVREYSNATPEDLTPSKEDASAARIAEAEKQADESLQNAWRIQRNAVANEMISAEVRKQTKGMDLSATIAADIEARARKSLNDHRKAQPDNSSRIGAFFTGKNLNGYLAYNKRIADDHLPGAVETAVGLYSRQSSRRAPVKAADASVAGTGTGIVAPTGAAGAQQATAGKAVMLTADQMKALNGSSISRYMKQPIGNKPGTTLADIKMKQYVIRAGNPWNFPDGTRVQIP